MRGDNPLIEQYVMDAAAAGIDPYEARVFAMAWEDNYFKYEPEVTDGTSQEDDNEGSK